MIHRFIIFPTLALAIAGCMSYEPHEWTRSEKLEKSAEAIPVEKLSGVRDQEVGYAVALLERVEYVELDDAGAERLSKRSIIRESGETIFLVRGVSWRGHPPLFRKVYVEASTRVLYVVGYDWDGEIFIPFLKRTSVASPIIVCLKFAPSTVVPKAIISGDGIFGFDHGALHESREKKVR